MARKRSLPNLRARRTYATGLSGRIYVVTGAIGGERVRDYWRADSPREAIEASYRKHGVKPGPVRRDAGALEGSAGFIEDVKRQLRIGDRQIRFKNVSTLGGVRYDDVYMNFVNLPEGVGGAGGGSEAENNRLSVWVRGFNRHDPHGPAPGKVKLETSNSTLYRGAGYGRENRVVIRGKSGTPAQIARYLAESLNRIVSEVPPRFTHTGR